MKSMGFAHTIPNIARATKAMLDPLYHPRHILPLASNLGTFRVRKLLAKEKNNNSRQPAHLFHFPMEGSETAGTFFKAHTPR